MTSVNSKALLFPQECGPGSSCMRWRDNHQQSVNEMEKTKKTQKTHSCALCYCFATQPTAGRDWVLKGEVILSWAIPRSDCKTRQCVLGIFGWLETHLASEVVTSFAASQLGKVGLPLQFWQGLLCISPLQILIQPGEQLECLRAAGRIHAESFRRSSRLPNGEFPSTTFGVTCPAHPSSRIVAANTSAPCIQFCLKS